MGTNLMPAKDSLLQYSDLPSAVAAAQDGSEKAWRTLTAEYGPRLERFLLKHRVSPADVEDVASDVWLRVVDGLPSLKSPQAFTSWILSIAANEAADYVKDDIAHRERFTRIADSVEEPGACVEPEASRYFDADRDLDTDILSANVIQCVRHLRPEYQDVLRMRFAYGMTYAEIAEEMGTPLNTIRTWLRRARRDFRRKWREAGHARP